MASSSSSPPSSSSSSRSSSFNRERVVYIAKLAMQAKRYDDVTEAMKKVAEMVGDLSGDERKLLLVGYKKKLQPRRVSWGLLHKLMEKDLENRNRIHDYIQKVGAEINGICEEVLTLIQQNLLPSFTSPDVFVFYTKMEGDFSRYQAVATTTDLSSMEVAFQRSSSTYLAATAIAWEYLPPTHPLRLSLAVNFSILNFQSCSTDWACEIAKKAIFDAVPGLGSLNKEACSDSIKIMKSLWDNTMLGKSGCVDYASDDENDQTT